MAYQTRCPECEAKLKLEDIPAADEAIECPKCGQTFTTAEANAKAKASLPPPSVAPTPGKSEKSGSGGGKKKKKRKTKKQKSNPVLLAMMGVGAVLLLAAIGFVGYTFVFSSGKLERMLSYVPADFNNVRGLNVYTVSKYPGYKAEMDKQMAAGPGSVANALADAAGADPEQFVDYIINARKVDGGLAGHVYVIRTRGTFDPKFGGKLGSDTTIAGQPAIKASGGALNNAIVYVPYPKTIVVVMPTSQQDAVAQATVAGNKGTEGTFAATLGTTGKNTARGHIWTLIRSSGGLSNYIKTLGAPAANDFKLIAEQMAKSRQLGIYIIFGAGGVKLGAALECDSKESAAEIKKMMREGPLGKGDDSEIPNMSKQVIQNSGVKEFKSEFLANIGYYSSNDCAYFETKVNIAKSQQLISPFNMPEMANR